MSISTTDFEGALVYADTHDSKIFYDPTEGEYVIPVTDLDWEYIRQRGFEDVTEENI